MLETNNNLKVTRFAFVLGTLSLSALIVTAWVLMNVRHEQAIVKSLLEHLRGEDLRVAGELSSELGLQWSLSASLVLNVIATAVAFAFVLRGYFSSERSLEDVKVLSTDILASMDAGVITTDLSGQIISINPRGRELVGIGTNQTPSTIQALSREHALLNTICQDIRKYHHPIRDRDYRVEQDGRCITLRAGCTMLRNRQNAELGLIIHVRDVTEKALMEERIRRMERYMGLGSLAAGLQHEIKNPLNALTLHIQLLCERLQKQDGDEEINEMLDILNTEVRRIGDVLDGFRNYASIHAIGRGPVDVQLLVEKLMRLLRPDADQKKIKLEFISTREHAGPIQADSAQFEQVLLNLALNAIAAMPDGGTLNFRISDQEDKVRIDISDTGNGISPEIQSQIFDPYFTTRSDGTGMGLALCDKIVRQHEGSIDFATGPRGTTFTLLLPNPTS